MGNKGKKYIVLVDLVDGTSYGFQANGFFPTLFEMRRPEDKKGIDIERFQMILRSDYDPTQDDQSKYTYP